MRKSLTLVLSVLLVLSLFAGCGQNQPAEPAPTNTAKAEPTATAAPTSTPVPEKSLKDIETTLEFPSWQATEPGFAEFWAYSIAEFNKEFPKVKINLYQIPYANYVDTLTTQFAAKTPPQITHIPSKFFTQFQDMGWFENLDNMMAQTDILQNWTKMQGGMQVDGKNYGLLLLGNAYSMFYNKKMLADAGLSVPKNIKEVQEAAQKLTKKDSKGNIEVFGFGTTSITHNGVFTGISQFIVGEGSHWSNPDGSLKSTDPGLIQAINDYKYFYDNKLIPLGITEEQKRQYFAEEKIAIIFDGPWVVSLLNKASEEVRSHIDLTSIPFSTLCGSLSNSVHIASAISDDEKALVWEFYKVLASPAAQTKYAEFTNSPAPRAGAITEELQKKNPYLLQMSQDANNGVDITPPGLAKNYNEFTKLVIDAVLNMTSDPKNTAEDMLTKLEKELKETLK